MYFAGDRLTTYRASTTDWRERPYPLVPDLAAEIVSPNDKVSQLDAKIDKYLADGVRLIWVIDPQRHKAVVYAPDLEQPIHLAGDQFLEGGDVIPGFQVPLSTLFD
jgi:Uma2 family endonuclease